MSEKPAFLPVITEAMEAHLFAQKLSSTHRILVRFPRNWVGHELKYCVSNSIPGETNSNPVGRTRFLRKKVSLSGFRK